MKHDVHWTTLVALALLALIAHEAVKLHQHLHYLECSQLGYITDTDGSVWSKSSATCARLEGNRP